ncbi:MAG TPA: DUF4339 domain-containing protein [Candidatus Dormibacteraeota bacterium]|nr:DUF4339 domain-containing protein [Candidatus Dormibacteraeota bacterium]
MYHMIGGDDREYGPVSAEQLHEWIAAGRANAETKLKKEGETDWKPLGTFTEFGDALAAKSAPPSPDPGLLPASTAPGPGAPPLPPASSFGPVDGDALAADALGRDYSVSVGLSLGRAWDLMKTDFWPIVGVSTLVLLVLGLTEGAYFGIILHGPLLGGLFAYYLKRIRGEPVQIGDAFSGFTRNFLQLFLGGLVSTLLIGVGCLFCVIPGIYLVVAWWMVYPILMEKELGFWDAMEVSRKVMTKHWWGMFLLLLLNALINLGGLLLCGVGVFVTMPLGLIATAYVYDDLFGPARTPAA